MRSILLFTGFAALGGLLPRTALAADFAFRSGPERVSLVELYTSEGCSSCPPAEGFLNALAHTNGLWTRYVPVAFHVDYWDKLGWPDPFAQPAFTQRQRAHASAQGANGVYTPNFVVDGREWRGYFHRSGLPQPEGNAGVLTARPGEDGRTVTVTYESEARGPLVAQVAVLGFGETSKVRRGENSGRTLHHDFVALATASAAFDAQGGTRSATVPLGDLPASGRVGLAIWVTREGSLEPLQAAGGYVTR